MAREATIFPQAIGLASTWEPELAVALADAVRVQMRAMGAHQGLSPVLDICRDPRWGRTEETFGEDPYLVAQMGVAFVRGLQGDDPRPGVIATAKHFVGYGASEGGLNWAPAHVGARELREVYLHPFEVTVRTAGLRSVMNAYNELDGLPAAADGGLLTTVLRERWGFEGCVVADYFSIRQLADYHHLAVDAEEAAAMALEAGLDVELPGTDCYGEPLLGPCARAGSASATIDTAVLRVLTASSSWGCSRSRSSSPIASRRSPTRPPTARSPGRSPASRSCCCATTGSCRCATELGSLAVIGPNADHARTCSATTRTRPTSNRSTRC